MNEITDGFPRTISVLGSLMDEFRQRAEDNPRIILRYLTDDPRDDNIREGIMVLARDTSDQRIRQWYQSLLQMAALRYAKETVEGNRVLNLKVTQNDKS